MTSRRGHLCPGLCTLGQPRHAAPEHQSTVGENSYRHPVCMASSEKDMQHWAGTEEFPCSQMPEERVTKSTKESLQALNF